MLGGAPSADAQLRAHAAASLRASYAAAAAARSASSWRCTAPVVAAPARRRAVEDPGRGVLVERQVEQSRRSRPRCRRRAAAPAPRPGGRGCGASGRPSRSRPSGSPPFSNQKTRLCSRNRPRTDRTSMVSDRPGTPGRSAQMPRISSSTGTPCLRGEVERVDDCLVDDGVRLDADPAGPPGAVVLDLARGSARAGPSAPSRARPAARRTTRCGE